MPFALMPKLGAKALAQKYNIGIPTGNGQDGLVKAIGLCQLS
jgi:hypothetical protein